MLTPDEMISADDAKQYSPLTLAFLGDCVYEELVRTELVLKANMHAKKLHAEAVKLVRAVYQSEAAHFLLEGHLSEEEEYIFKRGRNSSHIGAPKSAKNSDYRSATGLEALFGFLALTGRNDRIKELYRLIRESVAVSEQP